MDEVDRAIKHRLSGGGHYHHEGCVHNLPPEEQSRDARVDGGEVAGHRRPAARADHARSLGHTKLTYGPIISRTRRSSGR